MKQRVKYILVLMSVCTLCLLLFQFYWSYQAFQSASKTFKSDINEALQAAVDNEMERRQDEIVEKYKGWLADTNLVVIKCHIDSLSGLTVFSISDKAPSYGVADNDKVEFAIGYQEFDEKSATMTLRKKKYFIDRFVDTKIRENLKDGYTTYYTRRLGEKIEEWFKEVKLDEARLQQLYAEELRERGIHTKHSLAFKNKEVANAESFSYATRKFQFGFRKPFDEVRAYFPDPNKTLLLRMKWVLLSSLVLMAVTIFCFAYTVLTILRQKKLTELKNDFVNNMTHELRTPVATIGIAAEAIQEFNLSKTSADEYLTIIRQQSGRLSHLIDGILKNLAFEQDQLELSPRPMPLQQLAQQAILQHRPQLDVAGAAVKFDFPAQAVPVKVDELHLLNVLSNLIENALKYSRGTMVLQLSCREENGRAILALKDNGIGIPAAMQSKVFEKFFRVPSGNTHNTKGYGLGLSYAKTIIERHGGSITLQSRVQEGTTFLISLPVYQHEPAPGTVA
ncbi:sensor histidine kinase [Pontibacter diazotrophicus]|uniref:histidine kinase n=1 Tax=Pontibacter diazotrophicus TaxID=1400979 RepID=A0A3D8L6C6_9BACT|nr:HAMP domain-containing sensor histidine kinase [Pontibacter diazotrophicus]RDV12965.1 sensor histidine kinase [Pontibacter diazotrophicus]